MSLLDLLGINRIFAGGVELVTRKILNFTGAGVVITDDPLNHRTNITISGQLTGNTKPGLATLQVLSGGSSLVDPSPAVSDSSALVLITQSATDATGMVLPADAANAYHLTIVNMGSATATLKHNQTVAAGYAPFFIASGADKTIASGAVAHAVYDPGNYSIGPNDPTAGVPRWRVL